MAKTKYSTSPTRKHVHAYRKWWILGSLLLVLGVFTILELTNTTHIFHKRKTVTSTIPSTSPSSSNSNQNTDSPAPAGSSSPAPVTSGSDKNASNQTTGSDLIAPYGILVSNHRPGQNGTNLVESSQCTTTPGAKCSIKFTKDNVTKILEEKPVGNDGSVFWEWNITDAGLTSGNWTVTAIATMSNQIKTTTDQVELEVN